MTVNEVIIDFKVYKEMEAAAKDAYPSESCAVLLGAGNVIGDFKVIKNRASGLVSKHFYRINPLDLYEIEKEIDDETQKIVGIFHTHTYCESILSDEDKNHMIPGMIYVILSLTDTSLNRIRAYKKETENERIMEYGVKIL